MTSKANQEGEIMKKKVGRHELNMRWKLLVGYSKLLPDFDSSWSMELKELWYEAHRNAVSASLHLASLEDELEVEQKWP